MNEFYNEVKPNIKVSYSRHYITTDTQDRIIAGWSDGVFPERDTTDAICINEEGGYQFRLSPSGEENPILYTADGIPLYEWDGEKVQKRTEEEVEADRAAFPTPSPSKSEIERLKQDISDLEDALMELAEILTEV